MAIMDHIEFVVLIILFFGAVWFFPVNLVGFFYWLLKTHSQKTVENGSFYGASRTAGYLLGGFAILVSSDGLTQAGVHSRQKALECAKRGAIGVVFVVALIAFNQNVTMLGLS